MIYFSEIQDDSGSQKFLKPNTPTKTPDSVSTFVVSSTPQRKTTTTTITKTRPSPTVEIQDDEALLDEVLAGDQDDDSEGLNTSDVAPATDEEEQTDLSIRQRRTNQQKFFLSDLRKIIL